MKKYTTARLVKSEDLNHHGTLFAGRCAEWFVESCFVAAASALGKPENIVCLKIHGLKFIAPIKRGDIVTFESTLVHVGKTSMVVFCNVKTNRSENILVDGFITFISVDENGNKMPHNLPMVVPENDYEKRLLEMALSVINS